MIRYVDGSSTKRPGWVSERSTLHGSPASAASSTCSTSASGTWPRLNASRQPIAVSASSCCWQYRVPRVVHGKNTSRSMRRPWVWRA
ncbi:hypothetical protein HH212_09130 [Massilia forsythiae]|uniref:Uncharacterized protein n=1 Tax=Massilia forsythiae TaxID=2728020 RepID=A0A7Z2VVN9_9BURK|nr:hypothetical protein [Massilia forsythiae]QJE00167.1 hypothetical protein HH212_09130 [Massilia forsythiae]